MDEWEVVDICHKLGEWENSGESCIPITIESIINNSVAADKRDEIKEELLIGSLAQKSNYKLSKQKHDIQKILYS